MPGYKRPYTTRRPIRRRKMIKKVRGGQTKKLVDGPSAGNSLISTGISAIPYLVKSVGLLKSLINTEAKFNDLAATVTTLGTTVQYARLTGMANGTDDKSRLGNKVLLKDITLRFTVTKNVVPQNQTFRIILFVDKECDGALPISPNPLQTAQTCSPLHMDFSKRFVIIKSWTMALNLSANSQQYVKYYKELNIHCEYDGSTNAIGDAKENQVYLAYFSNDNVNQGTIDFYSRVKFYDT